jgi:hypothetical protein
VAPKTPLKIVPSTPPTGHQPPRALGEHGSNLWRSVHSEYAIEDAGGIELLAEACSALDRAEQCSTHIAADGVVIRSKAGLKEHPLLKHEIAARSFVVRTLSRLGLDVEAIKPVGRPPGR